MSVPLIGLFVIMNWVLLLSFWIGVLSCRWLKTPCGIIFCILVYILSFFSMKTQFDIKKEKVIGIIYDPLCRKIFF